MVEPRTRKLLEEHVLEHRGASPPVVAPATTTQPPGFSDCTECFHVALPTVSNTASTRPGAVPPWRTSPPRPSRAPARGVRASARSPTPATPPPTRARRARSRRRPAPCTRTVCPGTARAWVKSIRYAVSQAVPSDAARSAVQPAGRGSTLRRGPRRARRWSPGAVRTAGSAAGRASRRRGSPRRRRRRARRPPNRPPGSPSRRTQHHGHPRRAGPDPAQAPQVVPVERGDLDVDAHPPRGGSAAGASATSRADSGSSELARTARAASTRRRYPGRRPAPPVRRLVPVPGCPTTTTCPRCSRSSTSARPAPPATPPPTSSPARTSRTAPAPLRRAGARAGGVAAAGRWRPTAACTPCTPTSCSRRPGRPRRLRRGAAARRPVVLRPPRAGDAERRADPVGHRLVPDARRGSWTTPNRPPTCPTPRTSSATTPCWTPPTTRWPARWAAGRT